MGLVRCGEHGNQSGPLVCQHIRSALSHEPVPPGGRVVEGIADALGDGEVISMIALCDACAARIGVSASETVPWSCLEGADFADVAPCCQRCYDEWRRKG